MQHDPFLTPQLYVFNIYRFVFIFIVAYVNLQWRSQDFKVGGHTGDVARRADAGVGFLERGSAAGPLPIS